MNTSSPTSQDPGASALAFVNSAAGFNFATLSAEDKRINFKTFRAALIQWQMRVRASEFPIGAHFMQYNLAGFLTAQDFSIAFPTTPEPLPAPAHPIYPPNPTQQQVNVFTQEKALATAYSLSLDDLKYILERVFAADIAHLAHELTLFANVTPAAMYAAGHAAHGRLIPSDLMALRSATKAPVDRSLTPEENLVLFEKRHKTLADIGPAHAVNDGEKLLECTTFISSMARSTESIVERYYTEVDMDLRTTANLIAYTRAALARLPSQPVLSDNKRAFVAQTDDVPDLPEPDPLALAAAAAAPPHKSKGANSAADPSTETLRAFYDAAPVAKHYCFLHGFGPHSTDRCNDVVQRSSILTPAQTALKRPVLRNGKPVAVDGKLPSIALRPGFKKPI